MKTGFPTVRIGRIVIGALLGASAACGVMAVRSSGRAHASDDVTTAAQRQRYTERINQHYDYRFGADKPFLPSHATTDTGQFINPKAFPTAKYCGHCHQEAYAEWRQSVHANSFRTPWYVRNVNLLINGKGIEYSRHCEGCHNPIALVSGALTKGSTIDRKFDEDGITCSTCHSIRGHGGRMGPDLTDVGATRPLALIKEAVVGPFQRLEMAGQEAVSIRLKNGKEIQGIARNRNNYSLQVLDREGNLHLVSMLDVEQLTISARSLMPDDYGRRLSAPELQDLYAFLARQALRPRASSEALSK